MQLRLAVGRACRETRLDLDILQRQVAEAVGVSRGYIANIERGAANPSLDLVERIGEVLGVEFRLLSTPPLVLDSPRQRDFANARCSAYVDRRLRAAGWLVEREAAVVHDRTHGWIDLLGFHVASATLLVVEVKTRVEDIGAIERQLAWYERSSAGVARGFGWWPRRTASWLVLLSSDEVERAIQANRDVFSRAFPGRAAAMLDFLTVPSSGGAGRGLGLIDPSSKRRAWVIHTRLDGRRTAAAYLDYAEAARRLAR